MRDDGGTDPERAASAPTTFGCEKCGADLEFSPGTGVLVCPYCGHENPVPAIAGEVEEVDFHAQLAALSAGAPRVEEIVVQCDACGARTALGPNATAGRCAFCGSPVVATRHSVKAIRPGAVLPFGVPEKEAVAHFRKWLGRLWFAPSDLRQFATTEGRLQGIYVPCWTYDADTSSRYTGQRGEDYYVPQTYTTTDAKGRTTVRTRMVRRTRWYSVSGRVEVRFDDVLVHAGRSLPEKHAAKLEPWDLENLAPYSDEYLAGFSSESYSTDLEEGFEKARGIMDGAIRAEIRRDIGGDHQRIFSVHTSYRDVTFKHILLPVWLAVYRYREKTYRFLVNARTGEVQGERPVSVAKVVLAILLGLLVVGGIVAIVLLNR